MKELHTLIMMLGVTMEVAGERVVTALDLDNIVFHGLTYGAWFKLGLGVALICLIAERLSSVYRNIRGSK